MKIPIADTATPPIHWPLRWTVPSALLLFVAVATLWGLHMARTRVVGVVEDESITDLKWTVTRRQSVIERAARVNDDAAIQEEIASLGARRDISLAVLFDEKDTAIASIRIADRGRRIDQVFGDSATRLSSAPEHVERIRHELVGRVQLSAEGRTVVAIYPIVLGVNPGELRPQRIGTLFVVQDISLAKAQAVQAVTWQALEFFLMLALFAAGLALFFYFAVGSRLRRIVRAANQLGEGNSHIRSGVGGSDEVTELAAALDRAAERLADRQGRLEAILNTAGDAIIVIDDRGLIQSANPTTERLFGYRVEELVGKNVKMLMPAPYADEHDRYIARYLDSGERRIIGIGREVEGRRKDGSIFPCELAVNEFKVGERRYFAGTVRDISVRKANARELHLRNQAIDTAATAITIADLEGKLTYVNRAFLDMWGYEDQNEVLGMPATDLSSSEDDALPVIRALRDGGEWIGERLAKRKDGTPFEVQVSASAVRDEVGRTIASMASFVDISDRKRAERSLRVQQQAVEAAANGVVITDPNQPDNPIVYVNAAMRQITGYCSEEVIGRNCRFLQRDDRDQAVLKEVRAAISDQRECKVVLRNYRKDGTRFWNELTISPVRDELGVLSHFVGIISDVTARVEATETLARMNEELEQRVRERTRQLENAQEQLVRREKLAMLGHFAGGVAHEIRNPLGVIRNAVYFLQQVQGNADDDVRESLEEISRGLANSERIVSELLDYARGPQANHTRFVLDDALTAALRMIVVPRTVRVERSEGSRASVNADQGQTERLLANLIQNAVQAMPGGGTLTLSCTSDDGKAVVEVKDTGMGIPQENLEKVFEPLYTTRARGIGLGLSLCRRYAESNCGSLTVESEVGIGSTFVLSLPLG